MVVAVFEAQREVEEVDDIVKEDTLVELILELGEDFVAVAVAVAAVFVVVCGVNYLWVLHEMVEEEDGNAGVGVDNV